MPTVEETINTLKDMGFPEERAKKALNKTGWSGVEAAMEWLLSHPEDEDDEEDDVVAVESEAVVEKKPLTAEEKAAKLKELEELRVKKRKEREEREREENLEREKRRMNDGKAIGKLKQELEDQEIRKIAEERRREKKEAADAKRKVLEQIEADKRARQMEREAATPKAKEAGSKQPEASVPVQRSYDEAKLQIRLTNGQTMVKTFKAKETLSAVRLFVQLNRTDVPDAADAKVKLMTTFPRKIFNEEDYESPIESLGLCPSAVVIVSK